MDKNLHDIDKIFFDALEGQEDQPSRKVWESIDHGLDKKNIVITKRKYNNLKILSAALLLLLASSVVYTIYIKKYTTTPNKTDTIALLKKDHQNISVSTSEKEKGNSKVSASAQQQIKNFQQLITDSNSSPFPGPTSLKNNRVSIPDNKNNAGTEKIKTASIVADNNIKRPSAIKKIRQLHLSKAGSEKSNLLDVSSSANHLSKRLRILQDNGSNKEPAYRNAKLNKTEAAEKKEPAMAAQKSTIEKPTIKRALHYSPVGEIDEQKTARLIKAIEMKNNSTGKLTPPKVVVAKRGNKFHFSLMPYYSPQMNFDRIVADKDHNRLGGPGPGNDHDDIKKDETQKNAASFGIAVEIPLHKKWSIQTGLSYLSRNIAVHPKKIFAQKDNNGSIKYRMDLSSGYTYLSPKTGGTPVVGDSINATSSSNHLQYIGLPLSLQYTIGTGKFNIVPALGAVLNYRAGQNFTTNLVSGSTSEKHDVNNFEGNTKFYLNAVSQIAFQYNASKLISFDVVPALNLALTSINKASVVKSYPNSFSLAAGIKIRF